MNKRYAVIDLGTNTFHLVIAEQDDARYFKELYRKRYFVKLAESGIQTIGPQAFQRGVDTIKAFKKSIDDFQVSEVKAFGTAALRTASNGADFINQLFKETGIKVQMISGDREAELIYKGVIQAVNFKDTALIMDIGGGSVEFIIADQAGIKWAQSFPIGVAVLFNQFHKNNPISLQEVSQINAYLDSQLVPLIKILSLYSPSELIGASGTFDVLKDILSQKKPSVLHSIVKVKDFYPLYKDLLRSSLQQRLDRPDIPDSRAELIIVALLLIDFILKSTSIEIISVSAYAMKEGMLKELSQVN